MKTALRAPIRRRVGPAAESHLWGLRVGASVLIASAARLRHVQRSHEMEKSHLSITNLDGEFSLSLFFSTEQAKKTNIQLQLHSAVTDVSQVFVFMFLHTQQV